MTSLEDYVDAILNINPSDVAFKMQSLGIISENYRQESYSPDELKRALVHANLDDHELATVLNVDYDHAELVYMLNQDGGEYYYQDSTQMPPRFGGFAFPKNGFTLDEFMQLAIIVGAIILSIYLLRKM